MKQILNILMLLALTLIWSCSAGTNLNNENYSPPSIKNQPKLIFPISAQAKGIYGVTKVLISVSDEGTVKDAKVIDSSGYEDLDAAALSYCKQLLFSPAKKGNDAIPSFVKLKVNFDYKNNAGNFDSYVRSVLSLYDRINSASDQEKRTQLQKKLFNKHIDFIREMNGEIRFNYYAKQVIQKELLPEWGNIWNSYPLTFLLFHDFIQRYPDCRFMSEVKSKLSDAVKSDIYFIENSPAFDENEQSLKEGILSKIKSFVSKNYPEIKLTFEKNEINT